MTLRSPGRPFKKSQKVALFALLGVLSFGEMYALKNDRDEYEAQHNKEFKTQMDNLAELFSQGKSLKAQEEELKRTVAWSSYVAVVNRHQQIRDDLKKVDSQIWRLVTHHSQRIGGIKEQYSHNPGGILTPTQLAAARDKALGKENDEFNNDFNETLLPQVESLIRRILVETGRADEAKTEDLANRYGLNLSDDPSSTQHLLDVLQTLSSTLQP